MPEMKKNSLQQPDATRNALVVKQQRRLYGGKDQRDLRFSVMLCTSIVYKLGSLDFNPAMNTTVEMQNA